uniref:CARD domain-containing protein n=1 Tax=Electrophorus electricus TaxID=8005 RepID=A0A4W4E115_ELEEL
MLDDLNDEKVLGDEEADRARCLIGSVKKKGPKACQILCEIHLQLGLNLQKWAKIRQADHLLWLHGGG